MDQFDEMVLTKIVRENPISEVLRKISRLYTNRAYRPGDVSRDRKAEAIYMIIDEAVRKIEEGPAKW